MSTETTTRTGGVLGCNVPVNLVVNANTSAVSILLPAISEDTGMSVDTLQWAVTGYSLVGAAVIVTSGSLGDTSSAGSESFSSAWGSSLSLAC